MSVTITFEKKHFMMMGVIIAIPFMFLAIMNIFATAPTGQYHSSDELFVAKNMSFNGYNLTNVGAISFIDDTIQASAASGGGSLGQSIMYLRKYSSAPAACPIDWIQADFQQASEGSYLHYIRTCYRTDQACQVMYLRKYSSAPAACPIDWIQADFQQASEGSYLHYIRTCYLCY